MMMMVIIIIGLIFINFLQIDYIYQAQIFN